MWKKPILGIFGSRGPFLDKRERRLTLSFINHNSLGIVMSIAAKKAGEAGFEIGQVIFAMAAKSEFFLCRSSRHIY